MGFRYFVMRCARPLGLQGWVRNRDDGTVEITAEGRRPDLETVLAAAREGPRGARVTHVDATWTAASGGLEPFDLSY